MRTRRSAIFSIVALLLVGCSADPARNSSGVEVFAGVPDPCALISESDVERITGVDVAAGLATGTGRGCTYLAPGGGDAAPIVSLLVEIDDSAEQFAEDMDLMKRQAAVSLLDVGEQSYEWASGQTAGAEARQDQMRVRVLVGGSDEPRAPAALLGLIAPRAWAPTAESVVD